MSPGNIPQYLSPLLSHAMDQIPPSQHRNTPIYVLATAGMRLLDESARNAILSATCQTLRTQYPFIVGKADQYGPCGDHVRVASGEEEGMWGWVAVNYLMDGFGHVPSDSFSSPGEANTILPLPEVEKEKEASLEKGISPTLVDTKHLHPTFGFLDMGGASTQIAFSPSIDELERSKFPPEELKSVSLRLLSGQAVEWPLFVASWLGFGTNRVRERYIETKVLEWQKENERLSSAMTAGTSSTIPTASASLFKPIEDPCLPKGLKLPPTSPLMPAFIGTGSFSECLESLQPLLDTTAPCPPPSSHCLFAGLPTPHIDFEREDQRGFIGISEYWYTAQQVLGLGGVWDWAEWEKGMEGFCARDWGDIKDGFQRDHGLEGTAVSWNVDL
jgi:Golgi apyrase